MLPGFRFLFAAIVLSMSILVFGLGAAALLRAAHEQFASTPPAWRSTPETMFAQQTEATKPVLALLRVDTPIEPPIASTPADTETMAALTPENSSPPEAAKPEIAVSETSPSPPVEAAPVQADVPAPTVETMIASVVPSVNEPAQAAPEPAGAASAPEADLTSTKTATLADPPVTIAPKAAAAKSDKSAIKKRQQAQRVKARRRMAQRARLTAQRTLLQPTDPFGQPAPAIRSR